MAHAKVDAEGTSVAGRALLVATVLALVAGCQEGVRPAETSDAVPALGPDSARPSEEEPSDVVVGEAAVAILARLAGLPWGGTCEAWRGGAAGGACSVPEAHYGGRMSPSEMWCDEGRAPSRGERLHFYGLGSDEPSHCGLGQYAVVIDSLPAGTADGLHARLEAGFIGAYGAPGEMASWDDREYDADDDGWTRVRVWRTPAEILLYLRTPASEPHSVGVMARTEALVGAVRRAHEVHHYPRTTLSPAPAADSIAARAIVSAFLRSGELLAGAGHDRPYGDRSLGWSPEDATDAVDETGRLLAAADSVTDPATAAALLYRADRLADRLGWWMTWAYDSPQAVDPAVRTSLMARLDTLGVAPEYSHLGDVWLYSNPLLFRIWERYPETELGEHVFLILQLSGWGRGMCRGGADQFETVIRNGRDFLDQRPESPLRPAIENTLATANETWWSAARATNDQYIAPEAYEEGADIAGERAVALYRGSARSFEGTAVGDDAALRAALITKGIDTRRRTYYCVYD